jgi:DNA-binding helix-hairpin-helix protein with protein kinase domain
MLATTRLYDNHGRRVDLGQPLKSGGEGAVYHLPSSPRLLAKIYHKPTAYKAEKLSAMVQGSSPDLLKIAAWPISTLHQIPNGPAVGFIMPKVSGA